MIDVTGALVIMIPKGKLSFSLYRVYRRYRNSAFIITTVDILYGFQDSSVTNRIPSTIGDPNPPTPYTGSMVDGIRNTTPICIQVPTAIHTNRTQGIRV